MEAPPPPRPHTEALSLGSSRTLGLLLASLGVAALSIWTLEAGALPIIPPEAAWRHVAWDGVVLASIAWLVLLVLRSVRWIWLLGPHTGARSMDVLLVGLVGLGALIVLPMRLGELVRPMLLRRRAPVSAWTAIGTIGAERVIDGLVLSASLLVTLTCAPARHDTQDLVPVASETIVATVRWAFAAFGSSLAVLVIAYWQRARFESVVARVLRPLSPGLSTHVLAALARTLEGLAFLPQRMALTWFGLTTAAYWALNGVVVLWLAEACALDLGFAEAWVVLGILALGVLMPNAPGYFGVFQLSTFIGLSLYLDAAVVTERGSVFVVLLYVVQVGGTLVTAVLAWGLLHVTRGNTPDGNVVHAEPPDVGAG